MNLFLPECQYLQQPKFMSRIKQLGKTFAFPEDAVTVAGEILKFLASVALIMETGLILLLWE